MLRHQAKVRIDALLWLAALVLIACASLKLKHRADRPPEVAQSLLDRKIAELVLDGVPLDEVLEKVGKAAGVKVIVDRTALQRMALQNFSSRLNEPVHLHLFDVRLGPALLSCSDQFNIVLESDGNVVRVTSADALPSEMRVYDVSDIVDRMLSSHFVPPPPDDTFIVAPPTRGIGMGPSPPLPSRRMNLTQALCNQVLEAAHPAGEAWNAMAFTDNLWVHDGGAVLYGLRRTHAAFAAILRTIRQSDRSYARTTRP